MYHLIVDTMPRARPCKKIDGRTLSLYHLCHLCSICYTRPQRRYLCLIWIVLSYFKNLGANWPRVLPAFTAAHSTVPVVFASLSRPASSFSPVHRSIWIACPAS